MLVYYENLLKFKYFATWGTSVFGRIIIGFGYFSEVLAFFLGMQVGSVCVCGSFVSLECLRQVN